MTNEYQYDLLRTYRYVRAGMVFLVALLGTAVFIQARSHGFDIEPSISAYYYTPVKPVFVASLCAVGTLLIVYRGNTNAEDGFLNASGFLAFVVAFVPTRPESSCVVGDLPGDTVAAINNNTSSLFVMATVAFIFTMLLERLRPEENLLSSRGGKASLVFSLVAFGILTLYFLAGRDSFICNGHNLAAILLFIGIVIVVGLNGWGLAVKQAQETGTTPRDHLWNRYFTGFLVMVGSIVVVLFFGPLLEVLPNWVFWLEGVLITQFATFWITQTIELWNEPTRGGPPVPEATPPPEPEETTGLDEVPAPAP